MPFASKAHRSKMRDLLARGKITKAQYDAIEAGTPDVLPDRAGGDSEDASDQQAPKKRKPSPFW